MKILKSAIKRIPKLGPLITEYYREYNAKKYAHPQDLFTHYYRSNFWGDPVSRSGHGSSVENTAAIRSALPKLLTQLGVQTILDAPCGDYNWFALVERGEARYVGGDIVEDIIIANQRHCDGKTSFITLDIMTSPLPKVDIWICRDCLIHFSNEDIRKVFKNFARSEIDWLLTTIFPDSRVNKDITTGRARPLNLCLEPFNFPEPEQLINECYLGRAMALWRRDKLEPYLVG